MNNSLVDQIRNAPADRPEGNFQDDNNNVKISQIGSGGTYTVQRQTRVGSKWGRPKLTFLHKDGEEWGLYPNAHCYLHARLRHSPDWRELLTTP